MFTAPHQGSTRSPTAVPTDLPETGSTRSSSSSSFNGPDEQPPPSKAEDIHSKRKRKRLTISCLTCRKRKIKCDRQKPCSSCIKNNVPAHLCIYDESPWVSSLIKDNKMTDELLNLKQENEHLTGLLKMNEKELNELRTLLINLNISPGNSAIDLNSVSESFRTQLEQLAQSLQRHSPTQDKNQSTLLNQPINIYQFSCFKQTKFLVKIFGPSSWQNFVMGSLKTSFMLDSCIPYIMDLISKNERRIEQLKTVKLRLFNESKMDYLKLKEMEEYLGNYDEVLRNVSHFCAVHKHTFFLTYVDDSRLMSDFHKIITRDRTTNNCKINIDLDGSESHIQLANLSSLLLILRVSIIVQDNSFERDKDERLVSYALHLFSSMMIMEQPTVPAIMALVLFQSYQVYNPLDFAAEIIPHGTSRDWSMCLMIAVNSALKLGLHTKMPSLYDPEHYNYISPFHLRQFWRSIIFMDFITSFQNGLPFSMSGYCDPSDDSESSMLLTQIDDDMPTMNDQICHQRITILRAVLSRFCTMNQSHSKTILKVDLANDYVNLKKMVIKLRRSNKSILKILDPLDRTLVHDMLWKVISLDELISVIYTLYLSFSSPTHILNSNVDKTCFMDLNFVDNFVLLKRYYNATLASVVCALRYCSWFFERVYSDPVWSKDLVLQFLCLKHMKQLCMKSSSLLLVMLMAKSRCTEIYEGAGKYRLDFESYFNQPENIPMDIFNMPFEDLEDLVWDQKDSYDVFNFENENILKNSVALIVKLFKTMSIQKSFLTIDRKWFISMELCYTSMIYCFSESKVIPKHFNWKDYENQGDFANFQKFYNVDDVNYFRKQHYSENKHKIMKVTSLLN